ncbi:hypothetical protein RJ639_019704 [Escallonia herrerae]|uniref:Ribosomal protein L34e superfamily protein n=1 Tax=Escallonia herrerae TaxID=1293975 RepID=A0AA89AHE1_9ASTE|nr:hypothetical protein RJ639_019704 [Escallonia herrerae]
MARHGTARHGMLPDAMHVELTGACSKLRKRQGNMERVEMLPMVDCRSLIEFCKAFEQRKLVADSSLGVHLRSASAKKQGSSLNPLAHSLCDHSPFAAVDVVILISVVGALGFLIVPCFKLILYGTSEVFPVVCDVLGDIISEAPIPYMVALIAAFIGVIVSILAWEILDLRARKCGKPYCKGLRKAVEFDIQLETEECVKYLPSVPATACGMKPLELGEDHKELEAELKRMAPLNGRTVLIFRAKCGCPAGRLEVWGAKKIRRIKK